MTALTPREAFGRALRELRTEQGLSQEELGERSGYSRNLIGMIERAEVNPTLDVLFLLAGALEMGPSEVIALAERYDPKPPERDRDNLPGRKSS